jgi:hypothetical protein
MLVAQTLSKYGNMYVVFIHHSARRHGTSERNWCSKQQQGKHYHPLLHRVPLLPPALRNCSANIFTNHANVAGRLQPIDCPTHVCERNNEYEWCMNSIWRFGALGGDVSSHFRSTSVKWATQRRTVRFRVENRSFKHPPTSRRIARMSAKTERRRTFCPSPPRFCGGHIRNHPFVPPPITLYPTPPFYFPSDGDALSPTLFSFYPAVRSSKTAIKHRHPLHAQPVVTDKLAVNGFA